MKNSIDNHRLHCRGPIYNHGYVHGLIDRIIHRRKDRSIPLKQFYVRLLIDCIR